MSAFFFLSHQTEPGTAANAATDGLGAGQGTACHGEWQGCLGRTCLRPDGTFFLALPELPMMRDGLLKRSLQRAVWAGFVLGTTCLAQAGSFVKNESLVTSQWDLIDAEYSQTRNQIVWSDSVGNLWTAGIDPVSGMFLPANGKGILVDTNASTTADLQTVGNGPEWATSSKGDQIVYTRFSVGAAHTMSNARLGLAETTDGVGWTSRFIAANLARNAPYASKDKGDTRPRISYVDPNGNHYWREIYDGSTEKQVKAYPASYRSLRFVKGARAAVYTAPVAGVKQVFRYWLDTGVSEQITFDAGNKDVHSVPWMWQAPEYSNDYVMLTLVDDTEMRIYRHTDSSTAAWQVIHSAKTSKNAVLNSPEPFTYKNKSYVFFAAATGNPNYPTSIWLSNINAASPLLRQLTDDSLPRMRSDPEVYLANDGAYLYFNRFNPALGKAGDRPNCDACSEGVYRTYTGLAAK